jgi:hypothetical protein
MGRGSAAKGAGVPYLALELLLTDKSEDRRPQDELDAIEVITSLDADRRTRFHVLLPKDHPGKHV